MLYSLLKILSYLWSSLIIVHDLIIHSLTRSNHEDIRYSRNMAVSNISSPSSNNSSHEQNASTHEVELLDLSTIILIFAGLICCWGLLCFARRLMISKMCATSSKTLHNKMFHRLMRAPMFFFDTNPVGRYCFSIRLCPWH